MKYLKLYNTTQEMQADIGNLERPYVTIAKDNMSNVVYGRYEELIVAPNQVAPPDEEPTVDIYIDNYIYTVCRDWNLANIRSWFNLPYEKLYYYNTYDPNNNETAESKEVDLGVFAPSNPVEHYHYYSYCNPI